MKTMKDIWNRGSGLRGRNTRSEPATIDVSDMETDNITEEIEKVLMEISGEQRSEKVRDPERGYHR